MYHKKQYFRSNRSIVLLLTLILTMVGITSCDLEYEMGSLQVGTPITVTLENGIEYYWSAEVIDGRKYEMTLSLVNPANYPAAESTAYLSMSGAGNIDCNDCIISNRGDIAKEDIVVTFVGPKSDEVSVIVSLSTERSEFTLSLRELDSP